jgi:hypothetical protein
MAATAAFYPFFTAMQLPYAPFGMDPALVGFSLWVAICLATATQGTRATGQVPFVYSIAPVMAAGLLGGPAAAAWVALLGTVPIRALRDGTARPDLLAGHAVRCLAATVGAVVMLGVRVAPVDPLQLRDLGAILIGTAAAVTVEQGLGLALWYARTGRQVNEAFAIISRVDWAIAARTGVSRASRDSSPARARRRKRSPELPLAGDAREDPLGIDPVHAGPVGHHEQVAGIVLGRAGQS